MVFAAAEPERDHLRLVANVDWLEQAQIKPGDRVSWPGTWTYSEAKAQAGDHSNTQYALLGLNAASETGIVVKPGVWELSRDHFEKYQNRDGGWAYTPRHGMSTGSMTCAGISSLIISGSRRYEGLEVLQGETIRDCGKGGANRPLMRAIDWLASHFQVGQNVPQGQVWKFYYLYGMERAGRLAGMRFIGGNDWYRQGAEALVHQQHPLSGFWRGAGQENELVATSFSLLFLAKGRAPVLINKLVHQPAGDWNHDPDDVRNLVNTVSHDWKSLLTWQIVEPANASVEDMLQAPILFFNGHEAPQFTAEAKQNIRSYLEQGGFLFADACCSSREFDQGFRRLIEEILPPPDYQLRPLPPEHPVWRARHLLSPDVHPLWGIEHGCRTVAIYSPRDLSCYWNQSEASPTNTAVIRSMRIAQNVVDYATGRELPPDKLVTREVHNLQNLAAPKRGALRIAKLRYAGDWNIAPQAIPNLMDALHKKPFQFNVHLSQKDLFPRDPQLVYFPLIYLHGRGTFSFPKEDLDAPAPSSRAGRRHAVRRRRLRQSRVRRGLPPLRLGVASRPSTRADPAHGRDLQRQGGLRPARLPVHQGGRRRQGLPAARGRQDQRPLGDHLLEARPGLLARAALGDRLQGVQLRERRRASPATSSSIRRSPDRRESGGGRAPAAWPAARRQFPRRSSGGSPRSSARPSCPS